MNIKRKMIDLDTRCPVCTRLDEDGGHTFLKCKGVKRVWTGMDCEGVRMALLNCQNAQQVCQHILNLDPQLRTKTIILLWDWRNARNKINAGEKSFTTEEVCFQIRKHISEFKLEEATPSTVVTRVERWMPPREHYIKINFDAAFSKETQQGAWGFIARTDEGNALAAGAGCMSNLSNALHAEARACVAAVEGTSHLGAFRVIFESDSKNLVAALNSGVYDMAELGVLYREVRSLCTAAFDAFEFAFCRRTCNAVAHSLAQYGKEMALVNSIWMEAVPDCVSGLVASDSAMHQV